jgi:hypothetical protein
MKKDVIYIDADDEITSIVDKVQNSKLDLIALVLPKRCTILQSSVNMKILKKTVDESSKNLVLITSEAAILPIAGTASLYVAKNLQSKPIIPVAPSLDESTVTISGDEAEPNLDPQKSIGELAGVAAVSATVKKGDQESPIEIGDDPEIDKSKGDKKKKPKKDRKLAVPDFSKFRTKLFIGIGAFLALIGLWYLLFVVMPRAVITVQMQYNDLPINLTAIGNPAVNSLDAQKMIVPSKVQTIEKTETNKFQSTGQKNNGEKATGTMTITNCDSNKTKTVSAGTRLTASNGAVFITNTAVNVPGSNFSGGQCEGDGKKDVEVTSQNPGDQYNLSSRSYSISGYTNFSAYGSAMSGGTSKMVKVVSQSDCDSAKETILNKKYDDQKGQLESQLKSAGFTPVSDSFTTDTANASCSPAVGDEANESTATVKVKISMNGVSTDAMNTLIQNEVNNKIDESNEKMYESGINSGTITTNEKKPDGSFSFTYSGDAKTGVNQDSTEIAKSVAGKKYGPTVTAIKSYPGVSDVKVKYSPIWVKKTPKNIKHIKVVFAEPDGSQ